MPRPHYGGSRKMSEFRVSGDMFGRYVTIPTGFDKQQHVYKVVGMIESNEGWQPRLHREGK